MNMSVVNSIKDKIKKTKKEIIILSNYIPPTDEELREMFPEEFERKSFPSSSKVQRKEFSNWNIKAIFEECSKHEYGSYAYIETVRGNTVIVCFPVKEYESSGFYETRIKRFCIAKRFQYMQKNNKLLEKKRKYIECLKEVISNDGE